MNWCSWGFSLLLLPAPGGSLPLSREGQCERVPCGGGLGGRGSLGGLGSPRSGSCSPWGSGRFCNLREHQRNVGRGQWDGEERDHYVRTSSPRKRAPLSGHRHLLRQRRFQAPFLLSCQKDSTAALREGGGEVRTHSKRRTAVSKVSGSARREMRPRKSFFCATSLAIKEKSENRAGVLRLGTRRAVFGSAETTFETSLCIIFR